MSEHTPITTDLRRHMVTDETCSMERLVGYLRIDEVAFVNLCDAIDAAHANLERENAELRERMTEPSGGDRSIGGVTFTVTPRIDWMRMADELDVFTQLVRGFANQVGGGPMSAEIPVLNASKAPEVEYYVMECTLTVERTETLGNATTERRSELNGYLSKEVLEAALDMMREVVRQ